MDKKTKTTNRSAGVRFADLKAELRHVRWPKWRTVGREKGVLRAGAEVTSLLVCASAFLWICNVAAVLLYR